MPEQRAPNVYGGDGRTHETAFKLRRVTDRDVVYLENGWLYDRYGMTQRPEPAYEEFCRGISRKTEKVDGSLYHVVTFGLSGGGTDSLYFDVTGIVQE